MPDLQHFPDLPGFVRHGRFGGAKIVVKLIDGNVGFKRFIEQKIDGSQGMN